jgi:hypothetical protein
MGFLGRIAWLRNRVEAGHVDVLQDVNAVLDVNIGGTDMPDEKLTPEDLERQNGEPLPDREAMSAIDPGIALGPPVPLDPGDSVFPTDPLPNK